PDCPRRSSGADGCTVSTHSTFVEPRRTFLRSANRRLFAHHAVSFSEKAARITERRRAVVGKQTSGRKSNPLADIAIRAADYHRLHGQSARLPPNAFDQNIQRAHRHAADDVFAENPYGKSPAADERRTVDVTADRFLGRIS